MRLNLRNNNVSNLLLVILLFSCFFPLLAWSQAGENTSQLIDYFTQEKVSLTAAINEIKNLALPTDSAQYKKLSLENEAMAVLNRAKIISFNSYLNNQKKLQQNFINQLKQLQQFSTEKHPISVQEKISRVNALNVINNHTIDLIQSSLDLANTYQKQLALYKEKLDLWQARELLHQQLKDIKRQEQGINNAIHKLFNHNLQLQQEIKETNNFKSTYVLEAKLLLNNQVINLNQQKIAELDLQKTLARADFTLLQTPDIRTLQKVTEIYKNMINQLADLEQSLKKMVSVLKKEQKHLTDLGLRQQFASLIQIINNHITGVTIQEQTLQEDLENHQQELKKQLSTRQSLSEYRFDTWPTIVSQIIRIPTQFYGYLQSLTLKVYDNYVWGNNYSLALMWLALIGCAIAFIFLKKILSFDFQDKERSRLSGYLYNGLLTLVSRNLNMITLTAIIFLILYFNNITFISYRLLFDLIIVWFSFRMCILIARLGLLERVSDSSGKDVRLYHRIKWVLVVGGWITGLMVLSYQLPLSTLMQDIFNRLFMIFLMFASVIAWGSREAVTYLLHPILKSKKIYLRNATMLLIILTPLTLFFTALIGLIGYINLAWSMSRYLLQLLIIISSYVLLRGLLFDVLELLSECMISKLANGWLWIEVILKPLDRILRLVLLIFCVFLMFELFDWHYDSVGVTQLRHIIQYPIVNVSGIYITLESVIEFLILLSVFAWISKWTREFCYRWLYRDTSDPGIRNSLSVFTQYAVILIGGFITLRVLGLDFSGMSMILGGLAVGMGFGLRDFASNVVGGLMLLIERPVREGDLITLGNYEGRVAHIGIRSMRVSSWDNMEVLIPNAETFNKPFTNWTHQDGIVRTVIPIKVSRADDPIVIQQLILDVLAIVPEIVDDPPVQVLLKKIDEALIEFEVRYFTNVQLYSQFEIRSKVLFAITAQFNAAGIHPPIQPLNVEIKKEAKEVHEKTTQLKTNSSSE